jgi:hypothetical protein
MFTRLEAGERWDWAWLRGRKALRPATPAPDRNVRRDVAQDPEPE